MKVKPPLRSMQKISLPSECISYSILNPRPSTHSRRLRSGSALGIIGMHDSTVMRISLSHTISPTEGRKMKSQPEVAGKAASKLIRERIDELGDWRSDTLARMRSLIREADPDVVEEWKGMGAPVWSNDGGICTGEAYKSRVKLSLRAL